jgi:hypothetical protein
MVMVARLSGEMVAAKGCSTATISIGFVGSNRLIFLFFF